jgi:RND family efflux transporter MFP subunit
MKLWLKKYKMWVGAVVAIGLFSWFMNTRKPHVQYDSFTVRTQPIEDTLELSGEVAAGNSATLRFGTGGLVTYLGAKEGDQVKKFQTIARIDSRQLQKVLDEKLNLYAIQRNTFDQTVDDNDNSLPGGDVGRTLRRLLEKNQYQLDNTVKDVEYQDLAVKLAGIYSPIEGILIHTPITTTGVTVVPTDTWNIVDPSSLYFAANLDETDLKRVTSGQKVNLKLDAYPDMSMDTMVSTIGFSPVETTTGTTYEVKVAIPAADMQSLRLGLNGTAAIVLTEKPNALVLPASAIANKNGSSYVYVKDGEKYTEHKVETGIENGGMVEIVSGVTDDQTIYQVK